MFEVLLKLKNDPTSVENIVMIVAMMKRLQVLTRRGRKKTREIPIKEEKTSGMNKSFKRELGQRTKGWSQKKILKRIRRPVSNNRPGAGKELEWKL